MGGLNIRVVQRWTRHKNVNTVLKYDDSRRDHAGELAEMLGEDDDLGEGLAPAPVPSAPRPKPGGVGARTGFIEAPARTKPTPAVVSEAPVDPASFAAYVPPGAGDQLAEIQRLRRRGWSLEGLAARYGVAVGAIRRVRVGAMRRWWRRSGGEARGGSGPGLAWRPGRGVDRHPEQGERSCRRMPSLR